MRNRSSHKAGNPILSSAEVQQLREMRKDGKSYQSLARIFGIGKSQAHRIVTGQQRKTR